MMGFFGNIINKIQKATRPRFELDKSSKSVQFLLDTDDEEYFTLQFNTLNTTNPHDPAILRATSIKGENSNLGSLYIEVIRLNMQNEWKMSAGSAFELFIKKEFADKNIEFIKSWDSRYSKLTKHKIDNIEVGLIWFSLNEEEVFIFDKKGKLFNDLLKIYNVSDKSLEIENLDEANLDIDSTITTSNMIEGFFGRED
jgi:hypothetical protein